MPKGEDHSELDILDSLEISDEPNRPSLRDIFLHKSDADADIILLSNYLQDRLAEGHGEMLFDLGSEDTGESLDFSIADWDNALARLRIAASRSNADTRILLTRNVGGDNEVGPSTSKGKAISGKLLIRKKPKDIDDVIETRIAVVGNGAVIDSHSSARRKLN